MYKALTYIHLPFTDVKKEPGDTITKEEWEAAGQTDADFENLVRDGAISDDPNAEIHKDHIPVPPGTPSMASMVQNARDMVARLGDEAPAELRAFAELDYQHVVAGDSGEGVSHVS